MIEESRELFKAMGCPCEIRLLHQDKQLAETVLAECLAEVRRFEQKYSRYLYESVVSEINRSSGRGPITVDEETLGLLNYAGVCYEQSDGLFDVTSGVFREIWHQGITRLPTGAQLGRCLERVGWDKVALGKDSIELKVTGAQIDLGGLVKEYVVDALMELLRQRGIEHGLINLGGDIGVVGPQADGSAWPIGVVNPFKSEQPIALIRISRGTISTSGSYERFFEVDGTRFSHLINPKTGWPVEGLMSVSVVAPQAVVSGSMSSIALLHTEPEALALLSKSGAGHLAVCKDGEIKGTFAESTKGNGSPHSGSF